MIVAVLVFGAVSLGAIVWFIIVVDRRDTKRNGGGRGERA